MPDFEEIYQTYFADVYRYVLALSRDEAVEEEVTQEGHPFRRKKIFNFMIRCLCPIFAAVILVSSVANALGLISM